MHSPTRVYTHPHSQRIFKVLIRVELMPIIREMEQIGKVAFVIIFIQKDYFLTLKNFFHQTAMSILPNKNLVPNDDN
jgi:hypothetical protein